MAGLGDIVIKGEDRTCEVQRGVESVGKVVLEAVFLRLGRYVDSISFGQSGGV